MSLEFKEIWSTLSKISVNDNTEKKGKFTYLLKVDHISLNSKDIMPPFQNYGLS